MTTKLLKDLLGRLPAHWNPNDYIACGSAILAAMGVREVRDLDVLVRHEFMVGDMKEMALPDPKALPYDPGTEKLRRSNRMIFALDQKKVDVWTSLPRIGAAFDFDKALKASIQFGRWKVLGPRPVLAIKALANRAGDIDDMKELVRLIERDSL